MATLAVRSLSKLGIAKHLKSFWFEFLPHSSQGNFYRLRTVINRYRPGNREAEISPRLPSDRFCHCRGKFRRRSNPRNHFIDSNDSRLATF